MKEAEFIALLRLQAIPNIGDISAKKLLSQFGTAEELFRAKKSDIKNIHGIGGERIKDFFATKYLDLAEKEWTYIQENNIEVNSFKCPNYPELLKHCADSPLLLFQKGNINLNNKLTLSIVGTRKATLQGISFVEETVEKLAPLNPVIISGFAYGIDIAAHKSALRNNLQTVACMAHGLDVIHPKTHAKYKNQVESNGGFITDFWHESPIDRTNFISRNRIIAGISEATLVVESDVKGGSLITADIAQSYNREVFTVPGRPSDRMSSGCNNLIKTQKAQAITCAEDIVYFLNWDLQPLPVQSQPQLFVDLSPEEEQIIQALKKLGKAELDVLALESKLPGHKVASLLLNLELNNLIRPLPGKLYEAI